MATIVEGNPNAPFSLATTPRCRVGATPFPGLLHFTLDAYLIMLSDKQGSIKYHFLSLWYDSTWDWTQVSGVISGHSNHHVQKEISLSAICFLNEFELICLHISITIISTQLNGFKYCYVSLTIPLNISHLFTHS